MVSGREGTSCQHLGEEGGPTHINRLHDQDCRRVSHSHKRQCRGGGVSEKAIGHCFQGDVQCGTRDCDVVGASLGVDLGDVYSADRRGS